MRITSDHHFRGYNYGMLASQRNNTPYTQTNLTPAAQPFFIYNLPLNGLKTLFWGNFFLNNWKDKESDLRFFQDEPGGTDKTNTILSDLQSTGSTTNFYPGRTRAYRERNSLGRYDGIFFGIYYEWKTQIGQFSVGTWIWNNLNRFGKYSWQEYFIWYEPPFWKKANLKFQYYLNTSFDNGGSAGTPFGITNGQNYISFETSHTFFADSIISITPKLQGGYVQNNDNVSKRAGVSNIVGSLKFDHKGFDFTFHVLYRPEPLLYDTSDANKSDGRLSAPNRQNLPDRVLADELNRRYPKEIANYLGYSYSNDKFLKTIFIFSIGYTVEF